MVRLRLELLETKQQMDEREKALRERLDHLKKEQAESANSAQVLRDHSEITPRTSLTDFPLPLQGR